MKKYAINLLVTAMTAVVGFAVQSADAYKLGYITDLSGPLAGSYTPVWEGFESYMNFKNASGGINGQNVEVVLADDGLRADRSVAAAKRQIELDQVIGIFGLSLSSTHAPTLAETSKFGVPVVTSFSGIPSAMEPADPFSYSAGVIFEVAGEVVGTLIKEILGSGKVVGATIDSVGGRAALRHNELMSKKQNYDWGDVIFPVRTADFTPYAQAVIDQNPDIVVGHYGAEHNLGMVTALRQLGYSGPYVIASYGASEDTVRQASDQSGGDENIYMVSRFAPATEEASGMAEMLEASKASGIDAPNSMHVTGWVLGMIADEALSNCGTDCDRQRLDASLKRISVDTKGLTGGPIQYTETDHYGPSYWRLYRWDGDQLVEASTWHQIDGLEFVNQ